jgi:CRISPR-associated protein Csx16
MTDTAYPPDLPIFVSGHPGAVEWARRRGIMARHVVHLDMDEVTPGLRIIGTLPAHLIAQVTSRGADFYHLAMDARQGDRHRELPADEMEALNARLMRVEVKVLADDVIWNDTTANQEAGHGI